MLPSRTDIAIRLRHLIEGRQTRTEVSAWATTFVCGDHPPVSDWAAWEALKKLVGADLIADTAGQYLFHDVDFKKWLDDLLNDRSG